MASKSPKPVLPPTDVILSDQSVAKGVEGPAFHNRCPSSTPSPSKKSPRSADPNQAPNTTALRLTLAGPFFLPTFIPFCLTDSYHRCHPERPKRSEGSRRTCISHRLLRQLRHAVPSFTQINPSRIRLGNQRRAPHPCRAFAAWVGSHLRSKHHGPASHPRRAVCYTLFLLISSPPHRCHPERPKRSEGSRRTCISQPLHRLDQCAHRRCPSSTPTPSKKSPKLAKQESGATFQIAKLAPDSAYQSLSLFFRLLRQ